MARNETESKIPYIEGCSIIYKLVNVGGSWVKNPQDSVNVVYGCSQAVIDYNKTI